MRAAKRGVRAENRMACPFESLLKIACAPVWWLARVVSNRYDFSMNDAERLRELIDRIARLNAAESWAAGLNPGQAAALAYLAAANRFSRAPSHVAEYLGSTRGTVSQTLKALARKGLAEEQASMSDRRSIRYDLTARGAALAAEAGAAERAFAAMPEAERRALGQGLSALLRGLLDERGGRAFGLCRTCRHHEATAAGRRCRLLDLALREEEAAQICHEHEAA